MSTKFWSENRKERDHLGDLAIDGRITLKWILRKYCVFGGFIGLRRDRL
jgi:hypothetical protein